MLNEFLHLELVKQAEKNSGAAASISYKEVNFPLDSQPPGYLWAAKAQVR